MQVNLYLDRDPQGPCSGDALADALKCIANACDSRSTAHNVIVQLQHCTYGLRARRGQPSISRKLVKQIFVDFVKCVMAAVMRKQQTRLRAQHGTRLNYDTTYSVGASLTAFDSEGRGCRFRASVCTVTGENGYVWVIALAPDDSHRIPSAIFCGLHGAELPPGLATHVTHEYMQMLRDVVASNGHLGRFPYIYTTDKSHADKNMWKNISAQVVQAYKIRNNGLIETPLGAVFFPTPFHLALVSASLALSM
jgi:ribosomal protein L14